MDEPLLRSPNRWRAGHPIVAVRSARPNGEPFANEPALVGSPAGRSLGSPVLRSKLDHPILSLISSSPRMVPFANEPSLFQIPEESPVTPPLSWTRRLDHDEVLLGEEARIRDRFISDSDLVSMEEGPEQFASPKTSRSRFSPCPTCTREDSDLRESRGEDVRTGSPKLPNLISPKSFSKMSAIPAHKTFHRSSSAPSVTPGNFCCKTALESSKDKKRKPRQASASEIVWQAALGVLIYLAVGVTIYMWKREEFLGTKTVALVDAIYFCVVTMCTIGYGDITPGSSSTKLFACVFVFVGFGFIDALLHGMVTFVLDKQEHLFLTAVEGGHHETARAYVMNAKKKRMRVRLKVCLAIGAVLLCMAIGVAGVHHVEKLGWIDAVYTTCMSVTTVGYGDKTFQTVRGRIFGSIWLLTSTLGVARGFLFLAEARLHSRHRKLAKLVLSKNITTTDLVAADLDHDGSVSKAEYVVFKLKEMGKLEEKDIVEVCQQFEKFDTHGNGHITIAQLTNMDN